MKHHHIWTAGFAGLLIAASTLALESTLPTEELGPYEVAKVSQDWHPPLLGDLPLEVTPVVPGEIGPPPIPPPANPVVEIAICLDTSGSMNGLIESAKQKLWRIVNEFIFVDPMPRLRVALYTYGNDGHDASIGWVRQETALTEDLDLVSERLFAQTTNGGTELVGRVVRAATRELDWSEEPMAVKMIVVAGNETADQDRQHPFPKSCSAAISRDIVVHAIYCGGEADADAESWRKVARLSDGQFAAIDQQGGMVVLATPFDQELTRLSNDLNGTYIAYGENGQRFAENQTRQDDNAVALNTEAAAARALCKANGIYNNAAWDLLDAVRVKNLVLAEIPEEQLPEEMKKMTPKQREEHLAEMRKKRGEIQTLINDISTNRQRYLDEEMKRQELDASHSFDSALRRAIRGQAEARGYRFKQAESAPVLPEPAPRAEESAQPPAVPAQQLGQTVTSG